LELGTGHTGANANNLIVSADNNFLTAGNNAASGGLRGGSHVIASIDNLRGFASNWAAKGNAGTPNRHLPVDAANAVVASNQQVKNIALP